MMGEFMDEVKDHGGKGKSDEEVGAVKAGHKSGSGQDDSENDAVGGQGTFSYFGDVGRRW